MIRECMGTPAVCDLLRVLMFISINNAHVKKLRNVALEILYLNMWWYVSFWTFFKQPIGQQSLNAESIMIPGRPMFTWFLGELAFNGSSAANMADEIMIQAKIRLPKFAWLQNQWQNTRNLKTTLFIWHSPIFELIEFLTHLFVWENKKKEVPAGIGCFFVAILYSDILRGRDPGSLSRYWSVTKPWKNAFTKQCTLLN